MNLKINNNWIKDDIESKALSLLKDKGICMYLGNKGDINYRLSLKEPFISTKDFKSLETIFKNITGVNFDLSAFKERRKSNDEDYVEVKLSITPEDLKLVIAEVFNPFNNDEFILQDNYTYKLNNFKPSVYMLLDYELKKELKFHLENSAIGKLILHLVNYDRQRLYWVINWLAYFFQGLKKSQVALVLLGEQGAGKGIFFNEVIKPLFGENFVKTINDKSLNTNYKGSLVENTLFSNLDEISAKNSSSASIKNFLKALVTNASITAEKKFKNLEKETPIYGQILITSNELYVLEIEPSDRRFTVFSTGINLSHCNFLDYGDYESLSNAIKNELESFAIYLKNYPIDEKIANTALNTIEKDDLIQQYQMTNYKPIKLTKLQKNVIEFSEAIRCRNLNLFNTIVDENKFQLKNEILLDFQYGIFRVENLLPAFKTLYGSRSFGTNSELLRELQKFNFNLFSTQNIKLYLIENEQKECFVLPRFFLNGVYNV
ncbi:primase-helicase family protein [Aliarcobacter cryaerophilus]|uniref:primase-helicase family protein n=1 Tax=Aliarcobacter cryaerophilus TaxID=28198 RepID=UPI00112F4D43|nr:primase-helicase family protein [Aliarcobacter cryaerophilus]